MRQPSRPGGNRGPENQHRDSPSSKPERRVNANVAGGKDSHLHRASLARAARGRGGERGMARLGRNRAHRRAAIRARPEPDHRDHRSLFEEASTRRRLGIAEAERPRLSIQRLSIPPAPRIGSQPSDAGANATDLSLQGKGAAAATGLAAVQNGMADKEIFQNY